MDAGSRRRLHVPRSFDGCARGQQLGGPNRRARVGRGRAPPPRLPSPFSNRSRARTMPLNTALVDVTTSRWWRPSTPIQADPEALTYLIARLASRPQEQRVCACAGALIAQNAIRHADAAMRLPAGDQRGQAHAGRVQQRAGRAGSILGVLDRRAGATTPIRSNRSPRIDGSTPLRQLFPAVPGQFGFPVAVDGYNWGSVRDWGWQSFADVFAPTLRGLRALGPGRPVMIAETASAPGPRRAAWVTDTLAAPTRTAWAPWSGSFLTRRPIGASQADLGQRGRGPFGPRWPRLAPRRRPDGGRAIGRRLDQQAILASGAARACEAQAVGTRGTRIAALARVAAKFAPGGRAGVAADGLRGSPSRLVRRIGT